LLAIGTITSGAALSASTWAEEREALAESGRQGPASRRQQPVGGVLW
jgi:hypothetical protein